MSDYQLLVIGAGPGGYTAALRAAKLGLKTAVVESDRPGGTCLNRGCVPTKTLLHSSRIYSDAVNGAHAGIHAREVSANIEEIFAHKRHVSQTLCAGIEAMFKSAKVELLRGRGVITAANTVEVSDAEGGRKSYTADHILVATGSVPARPNIPGLDLSGVMVSDELLEGADHLYESIVIIGGGVIGVEFATFYSDLGCKVTVIEGMDRLLPNMDRELGQNLALLLKKQGVEVFTNSFVQSVERGPRGMIVNFTAKDASAAAEGEVVLCAIGRRPNLDGVFADGLSVERRGASIAVDENYQTSIPGVYAVGDVSSTIQLAHVAAAQGAACVEALCGMKSKVSPSIVPSCIYCRPEIASVGMSEAEAKAADIPVKVGKCVMGANARTLIVGSGRSFMKIVAHAQTHEILGAQLMCENSTDMISQIAQAMANRQSAGQLLLAMRPHPTFEEAMTEALEDLCRKLEKEP